MGSQPSSCGCRTDDKVYTEVSLSRQQSNRPEFHTKKSHQKEEQDDHHGPVEESISQNGSKDSSIKGTSHSLNAFKNQVDLEVFSKEGQFILMSMELELPANIKQTPIVMALLEEEDEKGPLLGSETLYFGGIKNGKFHGLGLLEDLKEKKVHFGLFRCGLAEFYGIVSWFDQSYYEGGFHEGLKEGKGKLVIPSKDYFYYGEFRTGFRWGYGEETINQVNRYNGSFYRNHKEGQGTLETPEYTYSGVFKKNRFHGDGVCNWNDKRSYDGHWEAGHFHGAGVFRWPDGREFKGNYKHGKKHGVGEVYKNGELVSRATYHEGQIVEEKKSNSRFLKIDTELFNDSKSMNMSSKFSRTSKGSEFFDFNG